METTSPFPLFIFDKDKGRTMNQPIRALEDKILTALNEAADVEIEVKRLILTNVLNMVKLKADETIILEMKEENNG